MKQKVETTKVPKAVGPYSQAVIEGDLVFTSGQIHLGAKVEISMVAVKNI